MVCGVDAFPIVGEPNLTLFTQALKKLRYSRALVPGQVPGQDALNRLPFEPPPCGQTESDALPARWGRYGRGWGSRAHRRRTGGGAKVGP
jgi:hypothetical protein